MNRFVFDIGVYRCSRVTHFSQAKARVEREFEEVTKHWDIMGLKSESYHRVKHHLEEKHMIPWRYNQVVGWLRLYAQIGVVKAEYYKHKGKRVRFNTKRKEFLFDSWGEIEVWPEYEATSSEIFNEIDSALVELSKGKRFRNRYIDLEAFRAIGPYVDWKRLLWNE